MRIFKKCIIVTLVLALIVGVVWAITTWLIPPSKAKMERIFNRDKDRLTVVVNYLANLDYPYIYINKSCIKDGVMFTGANTRYQEIEDETVLNCLKKLLKNRKYLVIGKSDNTVFFEKWSFYEKDRGIAFSINKDEPPIVEFLVKSEPLYENGWYYYETDYEEYRI